MGEIVRLNLINHLVALFRAKFASNLAISNPVFRWESCKDSVWESVKKCSRLCSEIGTRGWISWVVCSLQAARRCTRVKHAVKLNHHASCSITGQNFQSDHTVSSRLRLVTRSSQKVESPECFVYWKLTFAFLIHSTINTLIPTKYRELQERILKETP